MIDPVIDPKVASLPKVTVRFENNPELFKNPSWVNFYRRVVDLVNNAAREHRDGDGFSILFHFPLNESVPVLARGVPYASIQWRAKTLLLFMGRNWVDVALKEMDNVEVSTHYREWQSNPNDVLAPILLEYHEWRVYKAEKELKEALAARDSYWDD
ncbi:MAG: hypothetical protein G01um101448_564 [Parcubacteria group bacterium Gr01-1014_48]|nr:MAG: hypothetical protein Greene041614_210 [Parcubacteria group bacterium Greene0416_14]TSC73758.1 MAG: hypothetical protein G01um101448_564 [Parcubacteria group bacterium Gr01-1014_48]TSD01186.1 MAG: hypothetical protein Greene101415_381 [Parcubacteria group bacterium Greene1014_15]TSD08191.1 MAG: hypothetical protein Greene07144_322 [Parcubacteria group bacterium Greene0714_4]